ncbi:galactosamine 6-phosphate isomerase AgaS [Clostridium cavendishii DSM 21758]|uniref:Galactosamine 6-phosphate isomerase AgaS n=1 Tax=Clostridium cavendishii DSM 21758 TaxID=1121302 RepID=A0A1M6H3F0_9CLOT|nr:SIS domain-containing protein [Clostridium cavendishii]SHJ16731.1 galactosamine 6-phosphate isomerase AgaS [Clostridium cavendishii DSM 21758]
MISGIDNNLIEALKCEYTATEINQQPRLWLETYKIIKENKEKIQNFFKDKLNKENIRIVLCGAGTSAFVGDTAAPYLSKLLNKRVEAVATTNVVSNPEQYIEKATPTIVVSFARSGNSPESVGTYDLFEQLSDDLYQVIITCNSEGELAKRARTKESNLLLLMPEESNDKSFAMTSSFSCMLLTTLLAFDIENIEKNYKKVEEVAKQGEKILSEQFNEMRDVMNFKSKRVVFLGSGSLMGLAREMALKNLELTSGNVISVHESVLGFRHGPKSIINNDTTVFILVSNDEYTYNYDKDLIKEIFTDEGEQKLVVLSYKDREELKYLSHKYVTLNGAEDLDDAYLALNYVLYAQLYALYSSIDLGISPDNPRPDGTVNRVVKGVTIHKFN